MPRKIYTDEFKQSLVDLYNSKPELTIDVVAKEYNVSHSALARWVSGTKINSVVNGKTYTNDEVKMLEKQVRELKLENEILKQAALILGKK